MAKRINVILPENTVRAIDSLSRPGERSAFIERAVQHYIYTVGAPALQDRLKEAAIRDYDINKQIAEDWFAVDQEAWDKLDAIRERAVKTGRKGAKSISRRSTRQ